MRTLLSNSRLWMVRAVKGLFFRENGGRMDTCKEEEKVNKRCVDERKATQVAAFFLKESDNYMRDFIKLVKLVYLADREALLELGYTLTKGTHYSLPKGPIVSEVYDWLKGRLIGEFWNQHIRRSGKYGVKLERDPGIGLLAESHILILRRVQKEYGNMRTWKLVKNVEALPEYRKPTGKRKSRPIQYVRILCHKKSGYTLEEGMAIAKENRAYDYLRDLVNQG
jgi:uncharacterized phage-associated protein